MCPGRRRAHGRQRRRLEPPGCKTAAAAASMRLRGCSVFKERRQGCSLTRRVQLQACDSEWAAADWVSELGVTYPDASDADDEYADAAGRLYSSIRVYRVVAAA